MAKRKPKLSKNRKNKFLLFPKIILLFVLLCVLGYAYYLFNNKTSFDTQQKQSPTFKNEISYKIPSGWKESLPEFADNKLVMIDSSDRDYEKTHPPGVSILISRGATNTNRPLSNLESQINPKHGVYGTILPETITSLLIDSRKAIKYTDNQEGFHDKYYVGVGADLWLIQVRYSSPEEYKKHEKEVQDFLNSVKFLKSPPPTAWFRVDLPEECALKADLDLKEIEYYLCETPFSKITIHPTELGRGRIVTSSSEIYLSNIPWTRTFLDKVENYNILYFTNENYVKDGRIIGVNFEPMSEDAVLYFENILSTLKRK